MNLKPLREEKNATQDSIAKLLNVQRYTYAKWEQGRAEPSINDLIKLAEIFEVSIDYLVGKEETMPTVHGTALSGLQHQLLSVFDLLSEVDKHKVIGYANALAF